MTSPDDLLTNSKIIVAHPDDEVLWFGSIIDKVDEILICYNDVPNNRKMGRSRSQVLADYPLKTIATLGVKESGSYQLGNWHQPVLTEVGMEFSRGGRKLKLMRALLASSGLKRFDRISVAEKRYAENYHTLETILRKRLTPADNIFTHNPWGEYGHEEHIQVFRVLETLRKEIGFKLWVSNYCGRNNWNLALGYTSRKDHDKVRLPVDKDQAQEIATLYKVNNCWTWYDDWQWADHDIILEAPLRNDLEIVPNFHPFQLNKLF